MKTPAALSALVAGDIENAIVASTPGGIERQEAEGQRKLTAQFTRLPKEYGLRGTIHESGIDRLGFVIGEPVDELFVAITPPAGWHMRPTSHSMHSDIIDDKGRVRGGVFYKAAFYDRRAHFNLSTRYGVESEYSDRDGGPWENGKRRTVVKDRSNGTLLHEYAWRENRDFNGGNEDDKAAIKWLETQHPSCADVFAYWD